jgi:sugar O-acyltransferase (sialic acid O-acetyltransferase NeuD family)
MNSKTKLVVFGASNFLSDIFDASIALGLTPSKIVMHLPESTGERDIPVAERVRRLAAIGVDVKVQRIAEFEPEDNERYILGPTTPTRQMLVEEISLRFRLEFCTLVHPTAYVSPLAAIGPGTFVGAKSVLAAGVRCHDHVFINRGVTIGHDTEIESFSRLQPGATVCSLSKIGKKVTIGAGATLVDRLRVGSGAFVGAGAVVVEDVPNSTLVVGVPARAIRHLAKS